MPEVIHSALALSMNWSLDLFPHSLEPSFLLCPLDRYETSLLVKRSIIPRKISNLWIVIRMVVNG